MKKYLHIFYAVLVYFVNFLTFTINHFFKILKNDKKLTKEETFFQTHIPITKAHKKSQTSLSGFFSIILRLS